MVARAGSRVILICLLALCLHGASAPAPALAAPVVSLAGTTRTFSPNGDGVGRYCTVKLRVRRTLYVHLAIYDLRWRPVRTFLKWRRLGPGSRRYAWDGLYAGRPRPNGYYRVRALFRLGRRTYRVLTTVLLDNVPPQVSIAATGSTQHFAGGGLALKVPYRIEDRSASFRLGLLAYEASEAVEPTGTVDASATLVGYKVVTSTRKTGELLWDGKGLAGDYLPAGLYKIRLLATDAGGNRGRSDYLPATLFQPVDVGGTVTNAADQPVADATVRVAGTTAWAKTDSHGAFTVVNCPLGTRTFTASKTGLPTATEDVSVNYETTSVALAMKSAGGFRSAVPKAYTITLSGRFLYKGKEASDPTYPIANAKVVVYDHVYGPFGVYICHRPFESGSTDSEGNFSISYQSDRWDEWNRPDVDIVAQVESSDGHAKVKSNILALYPQEYMPTSGYKDNSSSRTGLTFTDTGGRRAAWDMLDKIQKARDRWRDLTGWTRPSLWIKYPCDLDAGGEFSNFFDSIDIDEGYGWENTILREYGHAILYSAYETADGDNNAYDAYLDSTHLHDFWSGENGKSYVYQDSTGYSSEKDEVGAWTAFNEGWSRYSTSVLLDHDDGFELDVCYEGKDGNRVINSVSRVMWDLTDDDDSKLNYAWTPLPGDPLPGVQSRFNALYGDGDDDRMSGWGSGPHGDTFAKLWYVVDRKWPANALELRTWLQATSTPSQLSRRGMDAIYYRMGIRSGITENKPVVTTVTVTGVPQPDGAYRGRVKVWCRATDTDVGSNNEEDSDHLKVRFETKSETSRGAQTAWNHIGWTLQPTATPPPGQTGTNWYQVDYDTATRSPVEVVPDEANEGYLLNGGRTGPAIPDRRDRVWVRAIAFDDLAESNATTSNPFAVDNSPGAWDRCGRADDAGGYEQPNTDYISWEKNATYPNATYELRFKPSQIAAGTIAMESFGYLNGGPAHNEYVRAPTWRMNVRDDGKVQFWMNRYDGSGPGGGDWRVITGTTALEAGVWYHLAAQCGSGGMKLYVNGRLEASDSYTGYPEPDWSDGTLNSGAFSIGTYESIWAMDRTALGCYDEVRVSDVQRYPADFAPPSAPFAGDASTIELDHLDGTTNGDVNHGFTFELW